MSDHANGPHQGFRQVFDFVSHGVVFVLSIVTTQLNYHRPYALVRCKSAGLIAQTAHRQSAGPSLKLYGKKVGDRGVGRLKIYFGIAAAAGIASVAKTFFGISDVWMTIGVIAVIGIIALMHVESRLDKLEARVIHTDYSGILALLEGPRHTPKHQQPASLAAGGAISSWIRPEHEVLFHDFRWFAALLNKHLADPWAIEELPSTDARGYDAPEVGRTFAVWYNACKVGTFQVTLGAGMLISRQKSASERTARLELTLSYLRFIPYVYARGLLYELTIMVGSFDRACDDECRSKAQLAAADALAGHLWEAVRNPDLDPHFDFVVEGSYDLLRDQNDHWVKHGYDPMADGGDRQRD